MEKLTLDDPQPTTLKLSKQPATIDLINPKLRELYKEIAAAKGDYSRQNIILLKRDFRYPK